MALKTKIKLTPAYDWKSLLIEDITGTGITGYGSNQDPVGYRRASSNGVDIQQTRIEITAPSDTVDSPINLTSSQAYTLLSAGYVLDNVELGYPVDDYLEDGIWTIKYTPYFNPPASDMLTYVGSSLYKATFNLVYKQHFINATSILATIDGNYLDIVSIDFVTGTITFAQNVSAVDFAEVKIGLGVTGYTAFTKEIKECLDNKVADESLCPCECTDCELVKKYLLYDAIYLNCLQNNATKAQQIFDYLTKFCTDCGC